jgi:hypothetical protein
MRLAVGRSSPGIQETVKYGPEKKRGYGRCCASDVYSLWRNEELLGRV